jgi:hypothetical protein
MMRDPIIVVLRRAIIIQPESDKKRTGRYRTARLSFLAWDLIKLSGADIRTEQRIGDLVLRASARGGELPSVDDVDAAQ